MSKLRFLFVLFSLIVLAAPGRAQDREHGHGKSRGDAQHRQDRGDNRDERDDNENGDDGDRAENRDRHDRQDDEDDDRDENDDDDRRGVGRSGCVDAHGNNVCDVVNGRLPTTLPEMINAVLISRGQLTRNGSSWLGRGSFTPRFTNSGRSAPRQVTWLDRNGAVREVWLDNNGDGRADVVRLYRKGKLVRTVRR